MLACMIGGRSRPQDPLKELAATTPGLAPWQRALRGEEASAVPFVPPVPRGGTVAAPGAGPARGRGADESPEVERLYRAVWKAAGERLRSDRHADAVLAIVKEAKARADRAWSAAAAAVDRAGPAPIACRAGCAWCCHQAVAVLPAEALAIAAHLRRTLPEPELSRLVERLPTAAPRPGGEAARPLAARACVFLEGERCRIYPVRPFRCRGVQSRDAEICRWDAEHPGAPPSARPERAIPAPFVTLAGRLADAAARGVAAACLEAGLDHANLELASGVRLALTAVDAAQGYRAGEKLFAAAALMPEEPGSVSGDAGLRSGP